MCELKRNVHRLYSAKLVLDHRYLDPSGNDPSSSLGGNAHSVLAQYVFNSICRGRLSASGRTRKALVVTLGDDVIGESSGSSAGSGFTSDSHRVALAPDPSTSATFLIYGQVRQDEQSPQNGRPKLELLATRRKAPMKQEASRGHPAPRPGEPLPRGEYIRPLS